jgi:hypothetical protein
MQAASAASGLKPFQAIPVMTGGRRLVGHLPLIRDDRMTFIRLGAESPHPMLRVESPVGTVVMVTTPDLFHEVLVERHARLREERDDALLPRRPSRTRGSSPPPENSGGGSESSWRRCSTSGGAQGLRRRHDPLRAARGGRVASTAQRVEFAKEATRITMAIAGRTLLRHATRDEDTERLGDAITVALDWGSRRRPAGPYSLAHVVPSFALACAPRTTSRSDLADSGPRALGEAREALVLPGLRGSSRLREALDVLEGRVREMIASAQGAGALAARTCSRSLLAAKDDDDRRGDERSRRCATRCSRSSSRATRPPPRGSRGAIDLLCRHPEWYARCRGRGRRARPRAHPRRPPAIADHPACLQRGPAALPPGVFLRAHRHPRDRARRATALPALREHSSMPLGGPSQPPGVGRPRALRPRPLSPRARGRAAQEPRGCPSAPVRGCASGITSR